METKKLKVLKLAPIVTSDKKTFLTLFAFPFFNASEIGGRKESLGIKRDKGLRVESIF
ncbi:hypothetical protein [Riemerella columbina]|uniref:hypothetical protein n=1 Tax=Riemerella columbina TaxID=103810 RepID=UPI0026702904|nr:hypothetical protein [Riemerella columbina]WKS94961.1 hypothetical protein NYR17_08530 [Riemerella columbina]